MLTYNANIEQDEDGRFVVTFPDLPYGVTDGATLDEALLEASDCLDEVLAGLLEKGETFPVSSPILKGQYSIEPSVLMCLKVAVHHSMKSKRLTKVELARKIHRDEKVVRRILDPHHKTKTKTMGAALRVLGKRVKVTIEDDEQMYV